MKQTNKKYLRYVMLFSTNIFTTKTLNVFLLLAKIHMKITCGAKNTRE